MYDFEARFDDTRINRFTTIDPLAEKYYSVSPYAYCANNPVKYIDPTGSYIDISQQMIDGKTIYTITITAKLINESGSAQTSEQMQAYANTIAQSFSAAYTGTDGDVSWVGVANISVASDSNPLADTDHAIRIVDQGTIDAIASHETGIKQEGVSGYAPFGEMVAYISSSSLDLTPATTGKYANTGLTENKDRTLGPLVAHEIGHSANLRHPRIATIERPELDRRYRQNLMHVGGHPHGGTKLLKEQVNHIYNSKNLINRGRQRIK